MCLFEPFDDAETSTTGGISFERAGFTLIVPNWMLELLLPRTDAGVYVQWGVMAPIWAMIAVVTRRWSKDARLFVWGLITMNIAWFMIRMAH